MNDTERRTLTLWYVGLAFGAIALGLSLYSLYHYHKDLKGKYDSKTPTLPSGR